MVTRFSLISGGTRLLALAVLLVLAWFLGGRYLVPYPERSAPDRVDGSGLINFLSQPVGGQFAAVKPGFVLQFPRDHGAHPSFRQEWWYFTGRLQSPEGREFGYQLTFFRFAAGDQPVEADSSWSADQSWMAHLAVTDVAGERFLAREDFSRQSLGLAGAVADPFAVWVNGWSVRAKPGSSHCNHCLFTHLSADAGDISIDFEVDEMGAPVLQGDAGYSRKTGDGRAASYYYSIPTIKTRGTLTIQEERWTVTGETWMDREWSSAVLTPGQSGWDWFSLNLDNGIKLMIFQVRDGGGQAFRHLAMLSPEGELTQLDSSTMTLNAERTWSSTHSGRRYPIDWSIAGESRDGPWSFSVSPVLDDQEVNLMFRYYEGLVTVQGEWQGNRVSGWGYMELTGYGD